MADKHTIIHLIEHDDGGMTTKRWPLEAERAHLTVDLLGQPATTAFMAAEDRRRLSPLAARASIVVDHRQGEAA
ncbi:hypothetical protein [Micromonospora maritima]|uniref:hypothetical protein n=1 Tax=Micromonospora maritima TaxID=986711 RepID=UPI00157D684A|nr:hypothetical protein [Micromonospora maritima]